MKQNETTLRYRIATRERDGWDTGTVNEPNWFATKAEAEAAIEALRASGDPDFAEAEYRVIEVR